MNTYTYIGIGIVLILLSVGSDLWKSIRQSTRDLPVLMSSMVGRPKPSLYLGRTDEGWISLKERSADSRPLGVSEVFRGDLYAPAAGNSKFVLRGARLDRSCDAAVWGDYVRQQLREEDCNQIIRGLYFDRSRHIIAQLSIVNLSSARGASRIVGILDPNKNDGFFAPLLEIGARFSPLGQGFSIASGEARGHYVVVTWSQRVNGTGGLGRIHRIPDDIGNAMTALGANSLGIFTKRDD